MSTAKIEFIINFIDIRMHGYCCMQVFYKGFHGDVSETFLIGNVDVAGRDLVNVTRMCLNKAIGICGPGQSFNLIGKTIRLAFCTGSLITVSFFIVHIKFLCMLILTNFMNRPDR